ncbi:hypothetical protein K2173_021722 [Erythroxylum novogranatense]|uniref:Uncharacterized protein n=1 Tax=Erythroxylum novogranatense TaxID=1862640 RepID=A0AAV8TIW3_9ROSI|nr:hypothetical protein K2173_021722 [Erythroxylum novogranatense]
MGKGRPRAVEKGVLGQNLNVGSSESLHVPLAPVYYPSEEEFKDPLEYIYKIRVEAEKYGICKIVPPKSWSPPFALNPDSFCFPTKTQAIHQLQARPASCDPKTFELEYSRFLESHCGKKLKKRVVFEGEELDFCKLFNAVKRFGGYDKVVKEKKWGEVSRFVSSGRKVSECAKHVLSQLYREHLYDYENYYNKLSKEVARGRKRNLQENKRVQNNFDAMRLKMRRKNASGKRINVTSKIEKEEGLDQICEQCRSGLHGEVMLLCDRCNKGWHTHCLSPPLKQIPPGNWYCFECLNSDKDSFGFVPGKQFTLEAFRRVADRVKKKWFGLGCPSWVQMERKFWEIVEGSAGEVEVMYGSDLDTSVYGSGFPRPHDQRPNSVEAKVWDEYCGCPWNLNNLPKLKGSVLRAVHHNITGVMVPWLYVGMVFSAFCWHFEDHCFYSMNYLHWGEPKCWYSVPGSEASAFEKVMRRSLPDLFDAQPDLLFQLVTMLNPSVLLENGVPVYSVLQEPGNFVITFPRSYHGGFNFGLNCAEAVNFAPADWLPHGAFGAELYQIYHKTAILSHEELLCVVAKSNSDSKISQYLKKELHRIYTKERTWRERLWKSGVIKSSPMPSRKCPEYVGTEEDPTCIICKQYLYLSAVTCCCRRSAFVCLEHWEHICECKSSKLCLLYRHTLAELYELVISKGKCNFEESPENDDLLWQISSSHDPKDMTKKVQCGVVSFSELAQQWLLSSNKILQNPYSGVAYNKQLKEAEQFLWAGYEMNAVRDAVKKLNAAQKWSDGIRDCLCRIKNWLCCHSCDFERVQMDYIKQLLNLDPAPCNEPDLHKLKEYAEEARLLIQDIHSALSSCSKISELESLYKRACEIPIKIEEIEKLSQKITSAKVLVDNARKYLSDECSSMIDIDVLYKLKSEIMELHVQLPETDALMDLLSKAELCQAQCIETMRAPCTLKNVEVLLQEWNNFNVNIPELKLLRQDHIDVTSWIDRCDKILVNVHERVDQDAVVDELRCLLEDGASLRINVDKLPSVEVELKKAHCREKALKAHDIKMPLDFIRKLMKEAASLQIEKEKLFLDLSGVLAAAKCWEESAAKILAHEFRISVFEDIIRSAADINAIMPSMAVVEDTITMAKSWLKKSEPFLTSCSNMAPGFCPLLKLEALKELVVQSKVLKVPLEEQGMLENVLKNCIEWKQVACAALQNVECVCDVRYISDGKISGLVAKIELLVTRLEAVTKAGLSLGFDFPEIPKLHNVCSMLQWAARVLSCCSTAPKLEDVDCLVTIAENLSASCVSGTFWSSLIAGVKWLKKAVRVISVPSKIERSSLSDAEEVLAESKMECLSFPVMVDQLVNAIEKHKLWQEQVNQIFNLNSKERTWSLLLELKELGMAVAFSCSELQVVFSEVERVEKWKQKCLMIIKGVMKDGNTLVDTLQQIGQSLDKSLHIFGKSQNCETRNFCMLCTAFIQDEAFTTCLNCEDSYHLQCLESASVSGSYTCPYCRLFHDGSVLEIGGGILRFGRMRTDLQSLIELLSESDDLSIGITEKETLKQVVEKALEYKICLREELGSASCCSNKDLSVVSHKLIIALKALEIAGVSDDQNDGDLEVALRRNCWRVNVNRLLGGIKKPTMQEIDRHIEEGVALNVPPGDCILQKLAEIKHIGSVWADQAKKVAIDSGALALDKVFDLIFEGENLAVCFSEELELLKARSMLYCICQKPYDDRAKVMCIRCSEWYHVDCVKILCPLEVFVCAACDPQFKTWPVAQLGDHERSTSTTFVEPKTPSPRQTKLKKKPEETDPSLAQKLYAITHCSRTYSDSGRTGQLWWQNRKPFRRSTRRRAEFESLSPIFRLEQ